MNGLKYLFIVVGLLVGIFFGVGLLLPSGSHVERSIVIEAKPSQVFPFISDHKESQKWSPWAAKDPAMLVEYENGTSGINATMRWRSENPEVGQGSSTFIDIENNKKVKMTLDFGDMMVSSAELRLDGSETTNATWSLEIEHKSVVSRYFGIFMDELVGADFEKGLASLKSVVEKMPKITTQEIRYSVGGINFKGYLAFPDNQKANPGILIVHEWWGHNSYARKRAEMLAALGYSAFALDLYGEGKLADHPDEAQAFMGEVKSQGRVAEERFDAALSLLKSQPATDANNIAAIGYCFGGAVALNMARIGKNIKAAVSFHGALGGLAPIAEGVKTPVLVLNGADDPLVKPEQVETFKNEMTEAGLLYELVNYEGVKHSFTNPEATDYGNKFNLPLEYNAEADADSWQRMQVFLKSVF